MSPGGPGPRLSAGAVVLAAGAGRRLGGVAKAALVLPDGRTFLAAILDACRGAGVEALVVVVAAPHGAAVAKLAGPLAVVWNPAPERGMAASLALGLQALEEQRRPAPLDAALAWPVDHPRVRPATVRAVLAAGGPDRAVVPTWAGRGGHPTLFGRALWPELAAVAARPVAGGARAVLGHDPARVVRLPVDDEGVLRDVDLPEDLPR